MNLHAYAMADCSILELAVVMSMVELERKEISSWVF